MFRVADSDGGIAPDMLGKIFSRFVSEGAEPGRKSGIGLGLSICQAIVEAHGGGISARNNDEGGATFEFWLPLERPADETAVESGQTSGAGPTAGAEPMSGTEPATGREPTESEPGQPQPPDARPADAQPPDPEPSAGEGARDGR